MAMRKAGHLLPLSASSVTALPEDQTNYQSPKSGYFFAIRHATICRPSEPILFRYVFRTQAGKMVKSANVPSINGSERKRRKKRHPNLREKGRMPFGENI